MADATGGVSVPSGDSVCAELARRQAEALERLATVSDPEYKPRRKLYQRIAAVVVASGGALVGVSEVGRILWEQRERRILVDNWVAGARRMYEVEGQTAVAQDMLARADALSPHNPDVAKLSAYIDGMQTMERLLNLDRPFDASDLDAWGRALGQAVMLERVDSSSPDGPLLQGQLQLAIREYDRAQGYLMRARELERRTGGRSPFSAWRLAYLHLKRSGQHIERGDEEAAQSSIAEANRLLDEAIALDGNFKWAHLERGQFLLKRSQEGDAEAALASFERTVAIDPRFAIGWQNLATAKLALGRQEEAIADLLHALEIRPNLPIAMVDLANAYGNQSSYEIALIFARRATEADPGSLHAWRYRGLLALERARKSLSDKALREALLLEAEEAMSSALRLDPRAWSVYCERSTLYRETGRVQQASDDAANAVRFGSDKGMTHLAKARAMLDARRLSECIDAVNNAISLHKDNDDDSCVLDEALFIRADAYGQLGKIDLARADWDASVAAMEELGAPPDLKARILCGRGQFREVRLNDLEGALTDFTRAAEVSETHRPAWEGKARVCALLQRHEDAADAERRLKLLRGESP